MPTRLTSGVRKTDEGWVVTAGTVKMLSALVGLLTVLGALGAKALAKSERIDNAVQVGEFRDTTGALRRDMQSIASDARNASQKSQAVSCYLARYPAGLCDDVPRAMQAGTPRDGTTTRRSHP